MTEKVAKPEKRRIVDHTARDARLAVASVVQMCEPLRTRIAIIEHRARRSHTADEKIAMVAECNDLATTLAAARTELLARLIDLPQKVLSHSRVTDIEKSLDNLETALARAKEVLDLSH